MKNVHYEAAQDAVKEVLEKVYTEKAALVEERFDQDTDATELYDRQRQLRAAVGESTDFYGNAGLPRVRGPRGPYPPAPVSHHKKVSALSEAEKTKLKAELTEIEGKLAIVCAAQQENFQKQMDLDLVIENLSRASAFLAAPDIMVLRFYEDQRGDRPY